MRALLSFFTVLPLRPATLDDVARHAYLLPLVGLVAGLPGALILASGLPPPGVAATLALAAVLLMAGLHHADGVLDVGDALMVRAGPERRREVLKDARVGIGGLGALFVVYAPTLAALIHLTNLSPLKAALALLVSEVAARCAMLFLLAWGRPAVVHSSATPLVISLKAGFRRYAAFLLAATLPTLLAVPLGWGALAAVTVPLAVALAALALSNKTFGGIGGDVAGATGETARMVLLVTLSSLL